MALAASVAMAQETPPAPTAKPAVPGAPAAPAATAAQQKAAAAAQADAAANAWVKLCMKSEQTENKETCLINHEGINPENGMLMVGAALRTVEGDEKKYLLLKLTTLYSLFMPAGIQIKIDEDEPVSLQYAVCGPTTCQGQIEVTPELFDKLRKGKRMVVAGLTMRQKPMPFAVPLTGFTKAFDGAGVDAAQYEAGRQQMMEQLRKQAQARAAELANKAKDGGAPAGAPAAGGAPAAPNASAAPPKTPAAPAPGQ